MHGLALLGLCAPITYIDKVGTLYIAASFSTEYSEPWGSHPDIDNNVRWTGTTVVHDGITLSRQEKMRVIDKYIKTQDPELYIRSCYKSDSGDNCSRCEKCSRTILGLEMAGIDPNEHGYDVNANTFASIREKLSSGIWKFEEDNQFYWENILHHAYLDRDPPHPEAKALINWLHRVEVETIKLKSQQIHSSLLKNIIFFYRPYCRYIPDLPLRIIKIMSLKLYHLLERARKILS